MLEAAAVQRRVVALGGPALLFERLRGSDFAAASNLFGTIERARFLFRHSLAGAQAMIQLRAKPPEALRKPRLALRAVGAVLNAPPKKVRSGPVLAGTTTISRLPLIQSWPRDGGPFITLPQVYTEDPHKPGILTSNLGMYRVQLAGNRYQTDHQIGLHYQIHRGIGVHHAAALERKERLRVSIFVGGPPAHSFAAVMPLPEGMPEVAFAGVLAGRRMRYARLAGHTIATEADFVICGTIEDGTLPEGPFGDHLGYYSLQHDFPVLRVEQVYHRKDAIWPFTVVGRPPQEDSVFGKLIHDLTGPMVPASIPGLKSMHAVDAAGVHPLLLAIGSERYVPYQERRPQELMTIANAVLGFGQASLAKYLWIAAGEDNPDLDLHSEPRFFAHMLERIDWRRDLHFQTRTTIDTLDYSGSGVNEGSKLVLTAAGPIKRTLLETSYSMQLPSGFEGARLVAPGIAVVEGPPFQSYALAGEQMAQLAAALGNDPHCNANALHQAGGPALPLIVLTDNLKFTATNWHNFVWVTFTRSNPSHDVYGVDENVEHKHWGCRGALIIDARSKPHHAWPLEEDPAVEKRVDRLFARGASLESLG